jgi:hypothetical protein
MKWQLQRKSSAERRKRRYSRFSPTGPLRRPRAADVALRSIYRWLKEPEFTAAYREARRAAFGQAVARLQQGTGAAAAVMLKLMADPGTPAATRLRAADYVFTHAKSAIELEEIEARIAGLEQAADLNKQGQ